MKQLYRGFSILFATVFLLAFLGACGEKEAPEEEESLSFLPNFNSVESAKMGAYMNHGYYLINQEYVFRAFTDSLEWTKVRELKGGEYVLLPTEEINSAYIDELQDASFLCEGPDQILYFINDELEIVRMPIGTEDYAVISETGIQTLQVAEGKLYYSKGEDYHFFSANLDGSGEQTVLNKEIYYPYVIDGFVIYQDDADGESIHLYDMTKKTDVKLLDGPAHAPNIVGNWLFCYYTDPETGFSQIIGGEFKESGEFEKQIFNYDDRYWYQDMHSFHYEIASLFDYGYGILSFSGANVLNYGADDWSLTEDITLGALPGYLIFDPQFPINARADDGYYSSEYGRIYGSNGEVKIRFFPRAFVFDGGLYEEGSEIEERVKEAMERAGTAQGSKSEPAGEAGYYVIESMSSDGETLDASFFEEAGIQYYIRLNEDHTLEINTDSLLSGTWENGMLYYTEDGEEYANEYVLDADLLTINADEGVVLVFRRSDAAPPESAPAAGAEAATLLSSAELKSIHAKLERDYESRALQEKVYEEVRDEYFGGVDGELYLNTEKISQYYWYVEGSDGWEYLNVIFQDYGSGIKTAGGMAVYLP